jgi:hypothetical protein
VRLLLLSTVALGSASSTVLPHPVIATIATINAAPLDRPVGAPQLFSHSA